MSLGQYNVIIGIGLYLGIRNKNMDFINAHLLNLYSFILLQMNTLNYYKICGLNN